MAFVHKDLLGIEGLQKADIEALFKQAETHIDTKRNRLKTTTRRTLEGKHLFNLFFENSTRTLMSFEVAAKRLGAMVTNFNISASSFAKGESLKDTIYTLSAMEPDFLVVRHNQSGMPAQIAAYTDAHVVNAGDGCHEHPTQALLDGFTIWKQKGTLKGLKIAICGDILHSRVARSNILLLNKMGAEVRVAAPATLMPIGVKALGVTPYFSFEKAITGVDVILLLRLQKERMQGAYMPSQSEYHYTFGLTRKRLALARKDALVLHPGPINRGIEIDEDIADDPKHSMILKQVKNGVAIRQAVLELLSRSRP